MGRYARRGRDHAALRARADYEHTSTASSCDQRRQSRAEAGRVADLRPARDAQRFPGLHRRRRRRVRIGSHERPCSTRPGILRPTSITAPRHARSLSETRGLRWGAGEFEGRRGKCGDRCKRSAGDDDTRSTAHTSHAEQRAVRLTGEPLIVRSGTCGRHHAVRAGVRHRPSTLEEGVIPSSSCVRRAVNCAGRSRENAKDVAVLPRRALSGRL